MSDFSGEVFTAIHNGDDRRLQWALDQGGCPNTPEACDEDCVPPLVVAARAGHPKCIEILLSAGADIEEYGDDDITALMAAALGGHAHVIQQLIDAGADVSASTGNHDTALYVAAEAGKAEAVDTLLRAGADATLTNIRILTPFDIAMQNSHLDVLEVFGKRNAAHSSEFGVREPIRRGHTDALAIMLRVVPNASEIINTPVVVNDKRPGSTALHYACELHKEEIAKLLLKNGAVAHMVDSSGRTPRQCWEAKGGKVPRRVDRLLRDAEGRVGQHVKAARRP